MHIHWAENSPADTYDDDIFAITIGFHCEIGALGSKEEYSK